MARALVLNASFEPLCVVSSRRALLLLLGDKAEMLHGGKGAFRAEKVSFDEPSVVRLRSFVKVPYNSGKSLNRRAVFIRDGGRCQYCSAAAESIDHVVPRSRGGKHVWENVVAACRSCNSRKRDRLLEETSFVLANQPMAPRQRIWLMGYANEPDWDRYLGFESLSA